MDLSANTAFTKIQKNKKFPFNSIDKEQQTPLMKTKMFPMKLSSSLITRGRIRMIRWQRLEDRTCKINQECKSSRLLTYRPCHLCN